MTPIFAHVLQQPALWSPFSQSILFVISKFLIFLPVLCFELWPSDLCKMPLDLPRDALMILNLKGTASKHMDTSPKPFESYHALASKIKTWSGGWNLTLSASFNRSEALPFEDVVSAGMLLTEC